MVKDEDVCLHCGLCAERCPTGAWDMQKFLLTTTQAGPPAAIRAIRGSGAGDRMKPRRGGIKAPPGRPKANSPAVRSTEGIVH